MAEPKKKKPTKKPVKPSPKKKAAKKLSVRAADKLVGRPTIYTDELATQVLASIAEGDSLRKIAGRDDMPSIFTIYTWIENIPGFSERYARAREDQAHSSADYVTDIADKTLLGLYEPAAARVAMDGYKWTAVKLLPKKYGDKIDHTTNGKDLPSPILGGISKHNEIQRDNSTS